MNRYLILCLCLNSLFLTAQSQEVLSRIESVTVFPSLAQINRKASVNLPSGKSSFTIRQLSDQVIENTLQLSLVGEGINIQKVSYYKDYLDSPELADEEEDLQDSLKRVNDRLALAQAEKEVLDGQEAILKANQRVYSNESGVSIEALEQLLNYYQKKLTALRQERIAVNKKIKRLGDLTKAIRRQLNSLSARLENETGEVIVTVDSRISQTVQLSLNYLVRNASWRPRYDVKATDLDQPLQVILKAVIRQTTGQDWTQTKIRLSNAEPLLDNTQPVFMPLFVRQIDINSGIDTVVAFDPETYEEQYQVVRNEIAAEEWSESEQNLTSRLITLNQVDDIRGDGREQMVTVWEKEIPAMIQYYSIPRESAYVYLLAEITNYGQYELEPGQANIFNGDTYIGETYLNTDSAEDTLQLSLGIDQDITVERAGRDFSEKKWLGANRKETYEYDLCIRNNKPQPVQVRLLDQIPISTNKDIEIELLKRDGAKFNKRTGQLDWLVEAQPNQAAHRKFSYSIRYPKNMQLTGKW